MNEQDQRVAVITGGSQGQGLPPLGRVGQISDIVGGQIAGH